MYLNLEIYFNNNDNSNKAFVLVYLTYPKEYSYKIPSRWVTLSTFWGVCSGRNIIFQEKPIEN